MTERSPEDHGWEVYASHADDATPSSPYQPGRFTRYDSRRERWRLRRRVTTSVLSIVAVVGLGAGAIGWTGVQGVGALGDLFDRDAPAAEAAEGAEHAEPVDLFTTAGTADLVAALAAETGSTRATHAVFYRDYAVVTVPDAAAGERTYYWNGDLDETSTVIAGGRPFNLARLDGRLLGELCTSAERPEPAESCFGVVARPVDGDDWLHVHGGPQASYVKADFSGRVVD